MTSDPLKHLAKADKTLSQLIKKVGPLTLEPEPKQSPYEALFRSVVYQQLSGKAAATILGRVLDLYPKKSFPKPEELLKTPDAKLRGAGLSNSKMLALQDIARKTADGLVPTKRAIAKMDDEEIIARLTQIRGVGRWTVEMLLIFNLGRPDVLPATDYGVRKGFALTYGHGDLPHPKELHAYGERWQPFRTAAAWYLWRSLELPEAREKKA